jgi:hypothetical protein
MTPQRTTVAGQLARPVVAGPFRRGLSDGESADAAHGRHHGRGHALSAFERRPSMPAEWSSPAGSVSSRHTVGGPERTAKSRPASSMTPSGGSVPSPSPFGPPGRGIVAGAAGVASAVAGSGVVAAILVAGLLLFSLQELRRFRLSPVMAGPVGFDSLLQRPG